MDSLYQQTEIAVYTCLAEAGKYYRQSFPLGNIRFDLKGRSAGQVRFPLVQKNSSDNFPILRFNAALLEQNGHAFIEEVVPHECAHIVVYYLFRQSGRLKKHRPKPHGIEWQTVMRDVFNLDARVTHNFTVASVSSKVFLYKCACDGKQHQLSLIRHNKLSRGVVRYLCKRCGDQLVACDDQLWANAASQNGS